jgi:hypothetical protein
MEGWQYLHAYTDRAISGASALRPAYQALLEDARRGRFDIVVAEALDRLSPDQKDVAGLFKRLRFAGVRLFTLAEGEVSELHVGLKGTMNALFLKGGTCSNRLNIRLDTLEAMILDGLRGELMAPELLKVFCEEFHREVNRLRIDGNAAGEAKRIDLDRIERRIRRTVDLITDSDAPARALKWELVDLEARQLTLQQELAATDALAPLIHPNLGEVYRSRDCTMRGATRRRGTKPSR